MMSKRWCLQTAVWVLVTAACSATITLRRTGLIAYEGREQYGHDVGLQSGNLDEAHVMSGRFSLDKVANCREHFIFSVKTWADRNRLAIDKIDSTKSTATIHVSFGMAFSYFELSYFVDGTAKIVRITVFLIDPDGNETKPNSLTTAYRLDILGDDLRGVLQCTDKR